MSFAIPPEHLPEITGDILSASWDEGPQDIRADLKAIAEHMERMTGMETEPIEFPWSEIVITGKDSEKLKLKLKPHKDGIMALNVETGEQFMIDSEPSLYITKGRIVITKQRSVANPGKSTPSI